MANDLKNLVSAPQLLHALFPGTKRRRLRWLRYRIKDGTMPSEKVGHYRVFDVAKCRAVVDRLLKRNGRGPGKKNLNREILERRRILKERK